jgi:hypothetical protein
MKIVSALSLALLLVIPTTSALTVTKGPNTSQDEEQPKLMDIKGVVKVDGDKTTFVTDADGKSWNVVNPEMLKGHAGHHVQLSAHVYADKGQIHIMKVTMIETP